MELSIQQNQELIEENQQDQENEIATAPDESSWRKFNFFERQRYLLDSGHLSDFTFIVWNNNVQKFIENAITSDSWGQLLSSKKDRNTFQCHKFILSHSSKVFEAMFYGAEEKDPSCMVHDTEPFLFYKMLEFIYTDKVDLENVETALGVYYLANKYQVERLCSECHQFIMTSFIRVTELYKVLEMAQRINNQELQDFAMKEICYNTLDVIAADSFLDIKLSTLLTILEKDNLNIISEGSLFSACVRWAQNHVTEEKSLRQILDPVLPLIRFRAMSFKDFAERVCKTEVLTQKEALQIFMCLASKTEKMPYGFYNQTANRLKRLQVRTAVLPFTYSFSFKYIVGGGNTFTTLFYTPKKLLRGVYLLGVQLASQSHLNYEENVKVQALDSVGTFKGEVFGGKNIDIFFQKPVSFDQAKKRRDGHLLSLTVTYESKPEQIFCHRVEYEYKLDSDSTIIIKSQHDDTITAIHLIKL